MLPKIMPPCQPPRGASDCPGCGRDTNSNGNCFNDACWNANSKRHDGGTQR